MSELEKNDEQASRLERAPAENAWAGINVEDGRGRARPLTLEIMQQAFEDAERIAREEPRPLFYTTLEELQLRAPRWVPPFVVVFGAWERRGDSYVSQVEVWDVPLRP